MCVDYIVRFVSQCLSDPKSLLEISPAAPGTVRKGYCYVNAKFP